METSHRRRRTPWLSAMLSVLLLVLGSIALAAPASADPSPQGQSAKGRTHQPAPTSHPAKKPHPAHPTKTHAAGSGSSGVSLPRPNSFQAQADPDGMANGGVDQPGGQGGIDTTSQDGNNGSGNDADCEDDNRGVGVPGHCKDRGEEPAPAPVPPVPGGGQLPGTQTGGVTLAAPGQVLDLTTQVLAPSPRPRAAAVESATATATRAAAASAPGVLPDTGAGQTLVALALAGLAALALGGGLLRQGRRTAS